MDRRLPLLAAALAAIPPFLLAVAAWPEIVVPAYFVGRGGMLYDTIIFPHTPLLILTTAFLGKLFGFSAGLFRTMIAASMACSAALIVAGSARKWPALLLGIPLYVAWMQLAEAIGLWPDPMLGPLVLAAALLLERGTRRDLAGAALLLGTCIVTKQTSAWLLVAALAWLASTRRSLRDVTLFALLGAAPYALFVAAWAAVYHTTSHVYWTLMVPLSGHAGEIGAAAEGVGVRAVALFAIVPLYLLAVRRWRDPLAWLAVGALGMAWPRFDLLHLSAAVPLVALMTVRAVAERRNAVLTIAIAAVIAFTAVAAARVKWFVAGPVFFWNDLASRTFAAQVRRRVPPGGAFLNFNTQWETLYAITGTTTPSGLYVNPRFWYYLNKRSLGARLCDDLRARHGTLVLFSWVDVHDDRGIARTCLYPLLARETRVVEVVNRRTSWRMIP